MKTNLNRTIDSKAGAIDFLYELHLNDEIFHPDDDAAHIIFLEEPTEEEIGTVNKLMDDCAKVCDISELTYQILFDDAVPFKYIDDNNKAFDPSRFHDLFHSSLWVKKENNKYYPI
jgi:hypothetical protein